MVEEEGDVREGEEDEVGHITRRIGKSFVQLLTRRAVDIRDPEGWGVLWWSVVGCFVVDVLRSWGGRSVVARVLVDVVRVWFVVCESDEEIALVDVDAEWFEGRMYLANVRIVTC